MTNRALVLAALADRPTEIEGPLVARDTRLMADALRALGCQIEESPESWRVDPPGPRESGRRKHIEIDVGNAGTVLRFLPAIAALTGADVTFRGDPRISQRPVGPLLAALRELGARITGDGTGAVPFTVHGAGALAGGPVTIDASASSQLVSGLLLAAARFGKGAEIIHDGPPVPSAPHIAMTIWMLHDRGVRVDADRWPDHEHQQPATRHWRVQPGTIAGGKVAIEPDLSNTVPFLAAAMVTGGEITVSGWPADSLQPTAQVIDLLTAMGADISSTRAGLRVSGQDGLHGVRADLSQLGELTPVLTALAALADSPSEFTGIGHVRSHETDRLAALATEIGKLGGDVTELADGLRIRPARLRGKGVVFDSYDDHRLVMAAAVLGLAAGGLLVRDAATVGKTFPGFGESWARMLA
jgi:3-phosphoshikimate 1-carboxyvinyltransferase